MLRLVHPPREGQESTRSPRPPGARSGALSLTVSAATLEAARTTRHRPSGPLVIRLAQAAGMSVEAILSKQLHAAGRCSVCGSSVGDRQARAGGAS